jgi:hypothetical protein
MSGDRYTLTALARDLAVGSRLLARRAVLLAQVGYRRATTFVTAARPSRAAGKPQNPPSPAGKAEGDGGEDAAPAPAATAPGRKPKKQGARPGGARGRTAETWLLTALGAWVAWCFLRRPLATGIHALVPDLLVLAPFAAVWWLIAAWLTAQHDKHRQAQQAGLPETAPGSEPTDGAPTREEVRAAEQWLHHLVITRVLDAARQGRKGVHLNALMAEPGIPTTWRVGTLKAHLERLAIPVTRNLKLKGAPGPTYGVREDELTAVLGMPLDQAARAFAPPPSVTVPVPPEQPPAETPAALPGGASDGPAGEGPERAPVGGILTRLFGALTRPAARPSRAPDATPSPAVSQPRPGGG